METKDFEIQILKKSSTYKKLTTIGKPNGKQYIYKYMNAERALEFISNKKICFVEPCAWADPYEKRFYEADYSNFKNFKPPEKIYSTCTTSKQKNEAAWKVYTYNNTGLASRCVLFKIKRNGFLNNLNEYAIKNDLDFYEGSANYSFDDSIIDNLHLRDKEHYNDYFKNFDLEKYLNLLLIKRKAFDYEHEIRYFLVNNTEETSKTLFISFNNLDLIEEIWYDKDCSEYEINHIKTICTKNNIKDNIKQFDLYYDPKIQIKVDSPN